MIGQQPVSSIVRGTSGIIVGYVEPLQLVELDYRLQPFVDVGIGVAYTRSGPMTYEFPTLGAASFTRTQRGSTLRLAWSVGGGIDVRNSPQNRVQ